MACLQAQRGLGGNMSHQTPAVSLLIVNGNIGILILYISHMSFVNMSPALGDKWALELLTSVVSGPTRLCARPWTVANALTQVHPASPPGSLSNLSYNLIYPHSAPMAIPFKGFLSDSMKVQKWPRSVKWRIKEKTQWTWTECPQKWKYISAIISARKQILCYVLAKDHPM